uniref:Olfactory receptor n=1 Tax=Castor canadensis TaxID=51338 RepID=A0A8C0X5D9_CASCN
LMANPNQTMVTEFVLQGFSEHPRLQLFLLGCLLSLYTVALTGSILIIVLVSSSAGLHSPMYFFLCNLATMDIICTSSVLPKVLLGLASDENTISFQGCMVQLFFLVWSASSELLLLTVMAYDRYVAICFPLHYSSRMSPQMCGVMAIGVWGICALNSSINTGLMPRLLFCDPKVINHFFCEIPPFLLLSCSPTRVNSIMTLLADAFYRGINFLLTLLSYGCILASILRMRSAEGKRKAFSTYRSKVAGVLYSALSPTLNPLICTLRNKEVKHALGRLLPSLQIM